MRYFIGLLIFSGFITLIGCSPRINPFSIYTPIPVEKVYQLQRDSTTRQQVEDLFGKPVRTSINERGDLYNYAYFGDSLFVQFNNSGKINRFSFEPEAFRIESDNQDILSRNFPKRVLRRIVPGRTRIPDLTPMFGKPNRQEIGTERRRTTFIGRNEDLIVYSTLGEGLVISYELAGK